MSRKRKKKQDATFLLLFLSPSLGKSQGDSILFKGKSFCFKKRQKVTRGFVAFLRFLPLSGSHEWKEKVVILGLLLAPDLLFSYVTALLKSTELLLWDMWSILLVFS